MRSQAFRKFGRQRGQSLVEFALAVPILAMVLFGIVEYGILLSDQIQMTNATRQGTRAAALHFEAIPIPDADRTAKATTAAQSATAALTSCPLQGSYNPKVTMNSAASPPWVTVELRCTYAPITPIGPLVNLFGATMSLSKTIKSSSTRFIEP